MKRTATIISTLILTASSLFAFEWPQENVTSESFSSYYGQSRGKTVNSSLIFKDSSEIQAAEDGTVTIVLSDHDDDFGWFESTLGNTVIIQHKDALSIVYSNLDEDSIPLSITKEAEIKQKQLIGSSGNSAWQEGQNCLELKVFDSKRGSSVNPRVLMPRIGKELKLSVGTVVLIDSNGKEHNLLLERKLSSGKYKIYKTRQPVTVPYKTVTAINGASVETINFDILKEKNGKLCVIGNRMYSFEELYPDDKKHLVSEIMLNKGHVTLSITVVNILGAAETISYNLDIQ